MRVHHLNCGSLREIPPVEGAGDGPEASRSLRSLRAVCHCLLVETASDGLILVDTGLGLGDCARPGERLGEDFLAFAAPLLSPAETAVRQLARLGHDPADVRHIVLTHLHRDHTGGLPDFPHATVHLHLAEHRAVTDPSAAHHRASLDRFMAAHRAHGPRLVPAVPQAGERWFGVPGVARLSGPASPDVLLVPLPGHTPGHSAVAVRTDGGRWLLHAGDAYFHRGELTAAPPAPHPALEPVQLGAETDREQRLAGLELLRRLHREHRAEIDVFSAHDPWEFARFADGGEA